MFALTGGELVMVLLIFTIIWCAGGLPRLGERIATRLAEQRERPRGGG